MGFPGLSAEPRIYLLNGDEPWPTEGQERDEGGSNKKRDFAEPRDFRILLPA